MTQRKMRYYWWKILLASLLVAGCSQIGPGTVPRDRFDYNQAVSDSWKAQTLLNIVKIRYVDMPLFMEVASIVSGYSLKSSVEVGSEIYDGDAEPDFLKLGAEGTFTDRPTITYKPITGAKFNKNFMTPLPPSAVMFLVQSGWPADIVLPLTIESINGLHARRSVGANQKVGDSDYYRVIQLLRTIQRSEGLGIHLADGGEEADKLIFVIRRKDVSPELKAAGDELADLLQLRRGATQYTISYGGMAENDMDLALLTRSMMTIMVELSGQIDVPEEHVSEGRTIASLMESVPPGADGFRRLLTVRHGMDKPDAAFVAIKYKDFWFWIDDRDYQSKRIFTYIMTLFSLTETGGKEGLPLITIPAG